MGVHPHQRGLDRLDRERGRRDHARQPHPADRRPELVRCAVRIEATRVASTVDELDARVRGCRTSRRRDGSCRGCRPRSRRRPSRAGPGRHGDEEALRHEPAHHGVEAGARRMPCRAARSVSRSIGPVSSSSTTSPPALSAASPYERPSPRAITPRGPADADRTSATSRLHRPAWHVGDAGSGARPSRVSEPALSHWTPRSRRSTSQTTPDQLQNVVAHHDVLGLACLAGVDVDRVAQDAEHERDDRDRLPGDAVVGGQRERPEAVAGDRDSGGRAPDEAKVGLGVARPASGGCRSRCPARSARSSACRRR